MSRGWLEIRQPKRTQAVQVKNCITVGFLWSSWARAVPGRSDHVLQDDFVCSLCHVRLCGREGPNLDFLCLCWSSRGTGSAAVTLPLGGGSDPGSSCSFFTHSKSFEKQESLALSQSHRVVQVRNIETYCSDEITFYIILRSTGLLQLFLSGSFWRFSPILFSTNPWNIFTFFSSHPYSIRDCKVGEKEVQDTIKKPWSQT